MALSFRNLIPLALLVGSFVCAHAQGAPPAGSDGPLVFTVFARNRQNGLQYLPTPDAAPQSVEFFGNTRSPAYESRTGGTVPFYDGAVLTVWCRARDADPLNPPALPAPVAIARVPSGVERALFLFIPARSPEPGAPRFHVYVVDDSPGNLPVGYASVINASGRAYMAKIGDHVLEVPQGVGGRVPVQGTVELRLATQAGDGWVVGGRHTFRLGERDRVSLVFFPPASATGVAPVIRTLVEEMPVEKTAGGSRMASAGR